MEFVAFSASGRLVLPRFPEVRGKLKTSKHNLIFANKTAGRGSRNLGCLATIAIWQMKNALRDVAVLLHDNNQDFCDSQALPLIS